MTRKVKETCNVDGCTKEANPDHDFQMLYETHGVTIKVTGLLCEEHWQQMMRGEEPPKESTQVKYCIECGQVANGAITGLVYECPLCKGALCPKCLMAHEKRAHAKDTQKEEEPKDGPFHGYNCADCKVPCDSHSLYVREGKIYCRGCYRKHEMFGWEPKEEPKFAETCAACGLHFYRRIDGTWPERHLWQGKTFCHACYVKLYNQRYTYGDFYADPLENEGYSYTYSQHETRPPRTWTCRDCHKTLYEQNKRYTVGSDPGDVRCEACYSAFIAQQMFGGMNSNYSHRREYSTQYDMPNEDYERAKREAEEFAEKIRAKYSDFFGFGKQTSSGPFSYQPKQPKQEKRQQTQTSTLELPTNSIQAFRILGIEPTMSVEKIKKAYRKLAVQYHPDKPTGDAAKMKQVNVANDLCMKYAGKK